MIKSILFNIDDTLYDSSLQLEMARMNAVKAMIEAGLPVDIERAFNTLSDIVKKYGRYYSKHFDGMLEHLGLKSDPRIIAAGVVAYRETSLVFLKPFPDTIPTLLNLRDNGYRLGIISDGDPVKQWQKLIKIGVHHLFHHVSIARQHGKDMVDDELLEFSLKELNVKPEEAALVSSTISCGISEAKSLGMVTICIRRKPISEIPEKITPTYEIDRISEILKIFK
jgi:putative hydrolase of the HAD superfamily